MTERIVLDTSLETYRKYFSNAALMPPVVANTATPGSPLQIVHMPGSDILSADAVWGFVPNWRKHADNPTHYAAGATLTREWMFSVAFRNWRCIVPATSFSYLRVVDGVAMRYELTPVGGGLMLLGGIYEPNPYPAGVSAPTVALVTSNPNRMLAPHGLQVPLLLKRKQVMPWLRSRTNIDLVKTFLRPPSDDSLRLKISVEPGHGSMDMQVQADLEFACW